MSHRLRGRVPRELHQRADRDDRGDDQCDPTGRRIVAIFVGLADLGRGTGEERGHADELTGGQCRNSPALARAGRGRDHRQADAEKRHPQR